MTELTKARVVLVLNAAFTGAVRRGLQYDMGTALEPLRRALEEHEATIGFSQVDEFEFHLASAEAHGITDDPFRAWTRVALSMPPARAKLGRTFSVAVDGNRVYDEGLAGDLTASLKPLEGQGVVDEVRIDRWGDGPKVPAAFYDKHKPEPIT